MPTIEDRLPMCLTDLYFFDCKKNFQSIFCNGNRNEWNPIRSVIIRVKTKSDDRAAGVRFVYRDFTTRSLKNEMHGCCLVM